MLSGRTGVKCCLTPSLGEKRVDIRGGLLGKERVVGKMQYIDFGNFEMCLFNF